MNKNFLITLVLIVATVFTAYSQTVNDKPISEIDVAYVEIIGTTKLFSKKVNIEINFGQEDKLFSAKDTQVKGKDGKRKIFNSMIDALNFMSKNGYDFVDAYVITISTQNVHHYLLKKR